MNFFDPAKNKRIAIVSPIIAALIAGTYYIAMKMDFDAVSVILLAAPFRSLYASFSPLSRVLLR